MLRLFLSIAAIVITLLVWRGGIETNTAQVSSPSVVFFHFGHRTFTVPSNYFVFGDTNKGSHISLWFLWPEKQFYDQKYYYQFYKATGDENRRVRVMIGQSGPSRAGSLYRLVIKHTIPDSHTLNNIGLYEWKNIYRYDDDVFTDAPGPGLSVRILCDRQGSVPSPQCRMFADIDEDLDVQISFPRRYLEDWQAMKNYISELISSLETRSE